MVSQFHAIYIYKTNEPILNKMLSQWTNTHIAPFWTSEKFPKKFCSISFECLWLLNFVLNIKKEQKQKQKTNEPILTKML